MPAISTTRRNCISPHRPRVAGERRAVTRFRVSDCNLLLGLRQLPHLRAQPRVGPLPFELEQAQPLFVAAELIGQGGEELFDGLATLVEVTLGRLAGLHQTGVGQGQELGVVLFQGLGRQLGEDTGGQFPGLLVGGLTIGRQGALVLEEAAEPGQLGSTRPWLRPRAAAWRADSRAERRPAATTKADGDAHHGADHDPDDEPDDHDNQLQACMGVPPGRSRGSPALRGRGYRGGVTPSGMGTNQGDSGEEDHRRG